MRTDLQGQGQRFHTTQTSLEAYLQNALTKRINADLVLQDVEPRFARLLIREGFVREAVLGQCAGVEAIERWLGLPKTLIEVQAANQPLSQPIPPQVIDFNSLADRAIDTAADRLATLQRLAPHKALFIDWGAPVAATPFGAYSQHAKLGFELGALIERANQTDFNTQLGACTELQGTINGFHVHALNAGISWIAVLFDDKPDLNAVQTLHQVANEIRQNTPALLLRA